MATWSTPHLVLGCQLPRQLLPSRLLRCQSRLQFTVGPSQGRQLHVLQAVRGKSGRVGGISNVFAWHRGKTQCSRAAWSVTLLAISIAACQSAMGDCKRLQHHAAHLEVELIQSCIPLRSHLKGGEEWMVRASQTCAYSTVRLIQRRSAAGAGQARWNTTQHSAAQHSSAYKPPAMHWSANLPQTPGRSQPSTCWVLASNWSRSWAHRSSASL